MPSRPTGSVDVLQSMADLFADHDIGQALALAIVEVEPGEHVDIAVNPLPADDPIGALYGFTAPAKWLAFGVATNATSIGNDGASDRVRIVYLVDRAGRAVHAARGIELSAGADEATGRVPDICRRVLGLPTAPPSSDPRTLWDIDWLDRILANRLAADLGAPPPKWNELDALRRHRSSIEAPWAILRREVAAGMLDVGLPADLADWMDDGMFERELLARYPDLVGILTDLAELLPGTLMRRIIGLLC